MPLCLRGYRTMCAYAAIVVAALSGVYLTEMSISVPPPTLVTFEETIVPIITEVSGQIQRIYITEGATVGIGDPLIQLDTRGLLLKKHALETRIHSAELDLAETRPELLRLYTDLEQTQFDLDRLTITSPVDGEVMLMAPLHSGGILAAGTAIAVVVTRKLPRKTFVPDL